MFGLLVPATRYITVLSLHFDLKPSTNPDFFLLKRVTEDFGIDEFY